MALPPFNPDETLPQASDLISQYPGQSQTFRDVIESWLLSISTTDGELKNVFPDEVDFGTLTVNNATLYRNTNDASLVRISGGVGDTVGASIGLNGPDVVGSESFANYRATSHAFRNQAASNTFLTVDNTGLTLGTNFGITFAGTGAATTRTNLGVGTGDNVTFGNIISAGTIVSGSHATINGNLTVTGGFASETITQSGGNIYRTDGNAGLVRVNGGNAANTGANIELYGGTHASLPNEVIYDAATHTWRGMAGTTRATLSDTTLTLGSNIAIAFAGTGAATTRTNLGLGTMATMAQGTGSGDFQTNAANDAEFHRKGVDTMAVGDLPVSVAERTRIQTLLAQLGVDAIGKTVMARNNGAGTLNLGDTVDGATLTRAHTAGHDSVTLTGGQTWRCQGYCPANTISLFERTA